MKAMILAAGRGERMRPLTDHMPKPLLPIAGRAMIEYTIEALVAAGFNEIIINLAYLGEQISQHLGNGKKFNANIFYADEGDSALETAGGIIHALPLLGKHPFAVISGDIATDFPFASLRNIKVKQAHLVLTPNPKYHSEGDFGLQNGIVNQCPNNRLTFSGIGVYHPNLFKQCKQGKLRLADLLRKNIDYMQITGELFNGFWLDVGALDRMQILEQRYRLL